MYWISSFPSYFSIHNTNIALMKMQADCSSYKTRIQLEGEEGVSRGDCGKVKI